MLPHAGMQLVQVKQMLGSIANTVAYLWSMADEMEMNFVELLGCGIRVNSFGACGVSCAI